MNYDSHLDNFYIILYKYKRNSVYYLKIESSDFSVPSSDEAEKNMAWESVILGILVCSGGN